MFSEQDHSAPLSSCRLEHICEINEQTQGRMHMSNSFCKLTCIQKTRVSCFCFVLEKQILCFRLVWFSRPFTAAHLGGAPFWVLCFKMDIGKRGSFRGRLVGQAQVWKYQEKDKCMFESRERWEEKGVTNCCVQLFEKFSYWVWSGYISYCSRI